MDERQTPVSIPVVSPQGGTSLEGVDDTKTVSFYASDPKVYSVETLDVHEPTLQTQMIQPPQEKGRMLKFSKRKAMVISTLVTLLVVLLTAASMLFIARQSPSKQNQSSTGGQQDVLLKDTDNAAVPTELQGTNQSLLVNGDFITRGTIKVSNSGFVSVIKTENPTANQSVVLPDASGTVCLDSNNCNYVSGNRLAELQSQVAALGQIAIPALGVTSLNNQAGALAIQGSLNQINVATSGGVLTLSTPQDLDANANVQFGSLTLGANGTIKANKFVQTSAGNSIDINAGSDMITFTAGGRVFQLPNSGAVSQTICTSGAACASGGGSPVLLSQPAAQTDSTVDASIFINDTGGGHLIRLQSGGVDRLSVDNAGNTTVDGSLTVASLGNGFVRSTGGNLSVVSAINLTTEVSGVLPVANGGTGSATPAGALSNLGGAASGANNDISSTTALNSITPSSALTIGATGQSLTLQGNGSTSISAAGGVDNTALVFAALSGTNTLTLPALTGTVCVSTGNCTATGTAGGDLTGTYPNPTIAPDAVTTGKIADGNVTNTKLQNSSLSVVSGAGLTNGGSISLGGSTTLDVGAGSGITVNANDVAVDSTVCRTTGNCAGVGGTGDILQDGNSFTALMTIGTNDAFDLSLETSGVARLTISSTGTATFAGAVVASSFAGDGAGLTNLDASNLGSGTVANGRISGSYTGITGVGTITAGIWQSSAIADAYLQDNITISSAGVVDWTALNSYPAACSAGEAITALGDTITCSPFSTGSGVSAIGTIDTQTKSSNGAVITGSSLVLQTADSSNPGLVSTIAQIFSGDKTFNGSVTVSSGIATEDQLKLTIAGGGAARFDGTITNVDLTSNQTYTLPDATGTFITTGNLTSITTTGTIVAGTWQGTAIADTYVADNLTVNSSGTVDWTALNNYPVACAAGTAITQLGDTVTCTAFAAGSGSGNYIQNQNASQQTAADYWISGTGRLDTGVLTPSLDTATAATLGVGTATASAVSLGRTGITTTNNGAFTVTQLLTGNGGAIIDGNTTIATTAGNTLGLGNTTGALTVIGSAASTFALNGITIDATEFNRLDGKDAALVDVNDAVATAITGVGTIATGVWQGTVVDAQYGGTGQSGYTVGDMLYASAGTTLSKLADVATGNVLLSGGVGVAPSYGKIGLTTHVSGTLGLGNGGTNSTSYTTNGVIYSNGTSLISTAASTLAGQCLLTSGIGTAPIWATCTAANLQSSYNISTGGTTPEIKVDATRGGLDIQDADSTIGGNLLTVRGSNAGGLGTALLSVDTSGNLQVAGNITPTTTPTQYSGDNTDTGVSPDQTIKLATTLAADGYARFVTRDFSANVVFVQCTNTLCSTSVTTTIEASGQDKKYAVVMGADGFARISYSYTAAAQVLRFIRCTNASCSTNVKTTAYTTANTVGYDPSITMGADGFARISSYDNTNQELVFTRCTNADCTTVVNTVVDTTGNVGQNSSVAIGSDTFARISYTDVTNNDLKFIQCTNADCSTRNTNTAYSTGVAGYATSLALGSDGFGRISHLDNTGGGSGGYLLYTRCTNAACTTSSTTTLKPSNGTSTSLALGSDGFARIAYPNYTVSGTRPLLNITQCTNDACSTSFTSYEDLKMYSYLPNYPDQITVKIDSNGMIMVGYVGTNFNQSATIRLYRQTGFTGGSSLGSDTSYFNKLFVGVAYAKAAFFSGYDLAENYYVDDTSITAGDIIAIHSGTTVEKASASGNTAAIGVISTKPGLTLSEWTADERTRPVALAGRVPVKVDGPIAIGDYITLSDIPGVGHKATMAGAVIGRALTGKDTEGVGTVEMFVSLTYWQPSLTDLLQNSTNMPSVYLEGTLDVAGGLNVSGSTTLASLTVTGDAEVQGHLAVTGDIATHNIVVNGHIITAGNTPTASTGIAAGQGGANGPNPTAVVDGNDSAGTVTITTGSLDTSGGILAHISFAEAFNGSYKLVLSASNDNAGLIRVHSIKTSTGFDIVANDPATMTTQYAFDYIVLGTK